MRCEVLESEDITTLYLRFEIIFEGKEPDLLKGLGGPLWLVIPSRNYVDVTGTFHETHDVEVAIYPHAGLRNRGQAKFTEYESRRAFWESLQGAVIDEVTNFVYDTAPGSVDVEGHFIRLESKSPA